MHPHRNSPLGLRRFASPVSATPSAHAPHPINSLPCTSIPVQCFAFHRPGLSVAGAVGNLILTLTFNLRDFTSPTHTLQPAPVRLRPSPSPPTHEREDISPFVENPSRIFSYRPVPPRTATPYSSSIGVPPSIIICTTLGDPEPDPILTVLSLDRLCEAAVWATIPPLLIVELAVLHSPPQVGSRLAHQLSCSLFFCPCSRPRTHGR